MKSVILACLVTFATSAKLGYRPDDTRKLIGWIRDDRQQTPESYAFDFESEDGIRRSETGRHLDHIENEPPGALGGYSFTFPIGELSKLKFIADEKWNLESPFLSVAPAFPHPIPQFVLEQIEKARRQDEEDATIKYSKDKVISSF